MQTDYFELFPSYWAVNSRSVTCLQLLLGHSPVPGVPDTARREEVENRAPVSPEPLGMHLGSLAGCLPCPIYCWWLLREKHLLCSVSKTPGMQRRRSSWAGEQAKEELGLRASPRGITPVETCTCLISLLKESFQSSLVDCDGPSHMWHSLHGILSAAGLQLWNFFFP